VLVALLLATFGAGASASAQVYSAAWDANTDPHTVGYRVFGGTSSGVYTWSVDAGNQTSANLPPLSPGATYFFVVRAYNATGQFGPPSNEATIDLGSRPGQPQGLSAAVAGSFVTLSWSAPAGSAGVTHYLVYAGTAPGAVNLVNGLSVGNALSVSGMVPPGRYYARVQAVNAFGPGPVSSEITFVAGGTDQPGNPTGLSVAWNGTVATLSWNPGSGATTYYVEAGSVTGAADLARIEVGPATRFSVDVPPGTYFVRVRAASASGVSGPSNEIVLQGRGGPERPTSLSATVSNRSTVELRWFAPTSGPQPTGYLIEAGSAPGLANLATLRVGPQTRFVTTNVPRGDYYVRVKALNARGASAPSDEIIVRIR
jgi:predicted phage tail protein